VAFLFPQLTSLFLFPQEQVKGHLILGILKVNPSDSVQKCLRWLASYARLCGDINLQSPAITG
jgi:hypothetical protein